MLYEVITPANGRTGTAGRQPGIGVLKQPVIASQPSAVHASPSSQSNGFGVLTTTSPTSSQESSVHPTPSSVTGGVPAWQSSVAWQVSAPLQKSASSQFASFGAFTTTSPTSSQESSVHPTPSSVTGGVPA